MEALTSKGNLFLLALGTVFLIDLIAGSPLTLWITEMMGRIQGHDPAHPGALRIVTPLGTYTDKNELARVQDIAVMAICYGIVLLSYLYNALITIREAARP